MLEAPSYHAIAAMAVTIAMFIAFARGRYPEEIISLITIAVIGVGLYFAPLAGGKPTDGLAIAFGGAMAGLGGAYVSLVRVPQWTDGITAGAGWIALAIVVFAAWKPWRALIGAYLFGGISVLQLNLQAAGARIPVEYLSMSPYVITILVLVVMSAGKGRGGRGNAALRAPASLGQNFHASR